MSSMRMEAADAGRLAQAAAWRVRLTELQADTNESFEAWLAADELNQTAWREVQTPWDLFGEHANSPELIEVRRSALGHAQKQRRRRRLVVLARGGNAQWVAAASVAILMVGALIWWNLSKPVVYRTATGESRVVTLSDGSRVALDAQSEVRVIYRKESRELRLVQGQARFDVAHDAGRPFSVVAGGQKVVAVGTAFNVDLLGPSVFITLIEGRVFVISEAITPVPAATAPFGSTSRQLELKAGEQLVATGSRRSIAPVNAQRTMAWLSGQIVFVNERLESVVERLNRYSPHHIEIDDPRVADMKISGVFNIGDINGFVSTVTSYLPVTATSDAGGTIEFASR